MALDTAPKRLAVTHLNLLGTVLPDGTISAADRAHLVGQFYAATSTATLEPLRLVPAVVLHAGSLAEQLAAWVRDAVGGVIDLSGVAIALELYDPTTGAIVVANAGTGTGSTGTGTGDQAADDPDIVVTLAAAVALVPANTRYRLRATCTVDDRPLIRTWPVVIRP